MKIGILQEGEVISGVSYAERYQQMIAEATLADTLGFSCWGTSEQHFSPPRFTVSAPEVLYAAVSQHTKKIKLRVMCSVLLKWNHPILVAERLATLDIVSGGRAELATARSNNLTTLTAFGVDPAETKAQWEDSMAVLAKALTDDVVEHDGPVWQIPPREIVPNCIQNPHPPVFVAASSAGSHKVAGERGLGVLSFESYFGFDYLQGCLDAYQEGRAANTSLLPKRNDHAGLYVATAFCAPKRNDAISKAKDVTLGYANFIADLYAPLGKEISYEYLDDHMARFLKNRNNLDFLVSETPSVMVGNPQDFVERLSDLAVRGVDEVLLRIDGMAHEDIMNSIRLIGEEVIPVVSKLDKEAA